MRRRQPGASRSIPGQCPRRKGRSGGHPPPSAEPPRPGCIPESSANLLATVAVRVILSGSDGQAAPERQLQRRILACRGTKPLRGAATASKDSSLAWRRVESGLQEPLLMNLAAAGPATGLHAPCLARCGTVRAGRAGSERSRRPGCCPWSQQVPYGHRSCPPVAKCLYFCSLAGPSGRSLLSPLPAPGETLSRREVSNQQRPLPLADTAEDS